MGTSVTLNGVSYTIPGVAEDNWGSDVGNLLIAIIGATVGAGGVLSKAGGAFTLSAETDFGTTYGLKSAYYKSRGTAAAAGVVRLANLETVSWRNAANSADLGLTVNASNVLQFNSANVLTAGTGLIVNADVNASAAIAYSKLALGSSIATGDLASGLLVPIGKGGTGQTTAATAYPALSPLTTKGDIQTYSTTTARLAVGADGTVLTASAAAATGLTWTSPLTNPMTSTGDIIVGGAAGAATRLAIGATGTVLKGGTTPSWATIVNADISSSAAIAGTKIVSAAAATSGVIAASGTQVLPIIADVSTSTTGVKVEVARSSPSSADTQNVYSGTYTPTPTNVSNVSLFTAKVTQWTRVGNHVNCFGRIVLTTTTSAVNKFTLTLPITPTNFTLLEQAGGSAVSDNGAKAVDSWFIEATTSAATVTFATWAMSTTGGADVMFNFWYRIS